MTLYLKYRPQRLDELDLESVRESLKKITSSKDIPHAFLFSGPKGTGKTSAARILAKIINCENLTKDGEPCGKCEQCVSISKGNNMDIIEIDAASHRGIDDIRTLRESVKLAPTKAAKKVYIIDEAHMLTTEASNALLKTLEEPPSHVTFIMATTNPEKLISTIHSRASKINFTKATPQELTRSLGRVVSGEKLKIKDELIESIARLARGSFRDGVKLLEQYSTEGEDFLTKSKDVDIDGFTELLYKKDRQNLLKSIQNLVDSGASFEDFLEKLTLRLRADLLEGIKRKELIYLLELLIEIPRQMETSLIEQLPLEIAIFKWCGSEEGDDVKEVKGLKVEQKEKVPEVEIHGSKLDDAVWSTILSKIHPINAVVEGLLRSSKPMEFDGKNLKLGVFYKFHKERLEDGHHKKVLEDVVASVIGGPIRVVCTLTELPARAPLTESKDQDILVAAKEIFGSNF